MLDLFLHLTQRIATYRESARRVRPPSRARLRPCRPARPTDVFGYRLADFETRSRYSKTDQRKPTLALQERNARYFHCYCQTACRKRFIFIYYTVTAGHDILQIIHREISVGEYSKGHADLEFHYETSSPTWSENNETRIFRLTSAMLISPELLVSSALNASRSFLLARSEKWKK